MINLQNFQRNIIFFGRIDQQAKSYHSSLSRQDNTKEQKTKQEKKQRKNKCILSLVFHESAFQVR